MGGISTRFDNLDEKISAAVKIKKKLDKLKQSMDAQQEKRMKEKEEQQVDSVENKSTEVVADADKNSAEGDLAKDPYSIGIMQYPIEVQTIGNEVKHWIEFQIEEIQSAKFEVAKENAQVDVDEIGEKYANAFDSKGNYKTGYIGSNIKTVVGDMIPSSTTASDIKNSLLSSTKAATNFLERNINNIKRMPQTTKMRGSVSIYMPDTILLTQQQDYADRSFNDVFGKLGALAQIGSGMIDVLEGGSDFISSSIASLTGTPAGIESIAVAGTYAANKTPLNLGENFKDALLRSAGYALNPQVELFFFGTSRREFQFDFRFNARSKKEAEQIQKILKTFRIYSSPKIPEIGNGRYFIPPSLFNIKFMFADPDNHGQAKENEKVPKIGRCVLDRIDINYVGSGKYMTFEDGQPIDIELRLSFKEVDIMTREAIEKGGY